LATPAARGVDVLGTILVYRQDRVVTEARWQALEKAGGTLTKEEMEEGWHWCNEMDFLLVGPGMHFFQNCKDTCLSNGTF
jgi:hypothetical protein